MSTSRGAVVRPATADDVVAVVDLMESVAAEGRWIGREAPIDRDFTTEQFASNVADPRHLAMVAERNLAVVGMIGLNDDGAGHAGLWMFLAPDARNQRIGTALLEAAVDWARSAEAIHKVTLQVWPHNAAAIALYRRHGFSVEGYLHRHWRRRNGELWDAILMGLHVDQPGSGRVDDPS